MLDAGRRLVDQVVDAVASRQQIDWEAVDRQASKSGVAEPLRRLRFLEDLGRREAGHAGSAAAAAPVDDASLPLWRASILWLAAAQVVLALLGFAVGEPDARAVPPLLPLLEVVAFSATAAWLLLGSPRDPRARDLAGFLLVNASANAQRFVLWLVALLPPPARGWPIWSGLLPDAFLPAFLWLFIQGFPRVLRLSRLEPVLRRGLQASLGLGAVLFLANLLEATLPESLGLPLAPLTRRHSYDIYWSLLFLACLPALVICLWRVGDAPAGERRRVRWFMTGLVLGVGPLLLDSLLWQFLPPYRAWLAEADAHGWSSAALYSLLLTVPFTTAYSVIGHGLFEFRFAARRAAGLLLAPPLLALVTGIAVGGLILQLRAYRDRSVGELLGAGSTGVLLVALGIGLVLFAGRHDVLRLLDRSLLGQRVEWQGLLAAFGADLRSARSLPELHRTLAGQVAEALHVERMGLFLAGPGGSAFEPVSDAGRTLGRDSALVALAQASRSVIHTDSQERRSLFHLLPEADRQWVADHNTLLLVPLEDSSGALIGLASIGPKKKDLPFSREDELFLAALATSAALALEIRELRLEGRSPAETTRSQEAAGCRRCRRVQPRGSTCGCGGILEPVPLPLRLNGKFEPVRLLGRGGMGLVFEAVDLDLGRTVALKALPRVSPEACLRLRREARSMASVLHPNLAEIYAVESWHGVPILVVEHLAGGTLAERVGRPCPLGPALDLVGRLAGALEILHENGLVHRDVKPSNIGFRRDGVPKLLDFGLVRLAEEAGVGRHASLGDEGAPATSASDTTRSYLAGTPLYLSPEAWAGGPVSPAQDLWALALVLYELIAGRHPLAGVTEATARRGSALRPPDVRTLAPDCPVPLAQFLARALDVDPRPRPRSAREMRQALTTLQGALASTS